MTLSGFAMPFPTERISAVIFDMDGVLIDSEPLWQQAEITAFAEIGIEVSRDLCRETAGVRLDEVLEIWRRRLPWKQPDIATMHTRIVQQVLALIAAHGRPLPGVIQVIQRLRSHGVPLAVASSSPPELIAAVIDKLGLNDCFALTHSGTHEVRGKPDPAIFLTTARKLGVDPARCLVFEDAPAGVLAAHRAGMRVIAIPSVHPPDHPGFVHAERILVSMVDFEDFRPAP